MSHGKGTIFENILGNKYITRIALCIMNAMFKYREICGYCDECKKYLFVGDDILVIEKYRLTLFNVQCCSEKCMREAVHWFGELKHLEWQQVTLGPEDVLDIYKVHSRVTAYKEKHPNTARLPALTMLTFFEDPGNPNYDWGRGPLEYW